MGAAKGHVKYGGRRKGVPNKVNAELKDMILGALNSSGGEAYLKDQAKDNPSAFLGLLGKILPRDISATVAGQMLLRVITGVPDAKPDADKDD